MSDEIVRSVVGDGEARVVAATTSALAREAARRHAAVGGTAAAMAKAATAGLLLATLTKDDERVTLQIRGDGPLGTITVDATSGGGVRVFVKHPQVAVGATPGVPVSVAAAVGKSGVVAVVRDLGLKEPFSGQTPLVTGEIDSDVEHYLFASEQIDSALACEALPSADLDVLRSAGVLVQAMPGSTGAALVAAIRERLRGGFVGRLLAAGAVSAERLAAAVLPENAPALRTLDVRPVRFHCPCSRERAAGALALLGPADRAELLDPDGGASVRCEFCGETYRFTPDEAAETRAPSRTPA